LSKRENKLIKRQLRIRYAEGLNNKELFSLQALETLPQVSDYELSHGKVNSRAFRRNSIIRVLSPPFL